MSRRPRPVEVDMYAIRVLLAQGPAASPGRVRGVDGKTYPRRPLSPDDHEFIVGRSHYLAHDEGKSIREIVAILAAEHRVTRSVGSVHAYLTQWVCERCSGAAEGTPEHSGGES